MPALKELDREALLQNLEKKAPANAILDEVMLFYKTCTGKEVPRPELVFEPCLWSHYLTKDKLHVCKYSSDVPNDQLHIKDLGSFANDVVHETGHHLQRVDERVKGHALLAELARRVGVEHTSIYKWSDWDEVSAEFLEAAFIARGKIKEASARDIINLLASNRLPKDAEKYNETHKTFPPEALEGFLRKTEAVFDVLGHANAWWETGDSQLGDEEVGRALILIDFIYNDFDAKTTVRDVVCAPARFILNLEKHWDARKGKDQRGWLDRKIKEARKLAELGLASGQVTLTPYRLRG